MKPIVHREYLDTPSHVHAFKRCSRCNRVESGYRWRGLDALPQPGYIQPVCTVAVMYGVCPECHSGTHHWLNSQTDPN